MPTLVLLRHAKSEWPPNVRDIERPLAERGIQDCVAVAAALTERNINVDFAVVSIAERTRETFRLVFESMKRVPDHEYETRIYEAHVQNLLDVVREQTAETVLIVGHGPGIPQLALLLCEDVESEPAKAIRRKYPTAGLAILTSHAPWDEWGAGMCELKEFTIPRANPLDADQD
jgi:phosphohistidine phosphatase